MKWLSIGPVVTTCVGIGFDIARKYDATWTITRRQ